VVYGVADPGVTGLLWSGLWPCCEATTLAILREHRGGSGGQRGDPLLVALAGAGDVRPGAEVKSDQHQSRRASV
jgi:hypothetical protein